MLQRYQTGEDREELAKATRTLTEEEEKKMKEGSVSATLLTAIQKEAHLISSQTLTRVLSFSDIPACRRPSSLKVSSASSTM
jgi:hypothetical protein